MRKDFGRLVIERERRGSSAKNLKMRKTGRFLLESPDWEEWDYDGPLRIRTRGLHGVKHTYDRQMGEKSFTDVLTPIRGYLRKSIGRRWDDVFSELTAALGRGSYPIRHVLTAHALEEVSIHTYCENGKIYSQPKQYEYGDYFVDPRDGTLRKVATRRRYRQAAPALDRRYWKCGLWFVRIEGIWYLGAYTKNAAMATICAQCDRLWPNVGVAGVIWYFVKWRQAGKKELKRAGVAGPCFRPSSDG
jgi:hypothetical protein